MDSTALLDLPNEVLRQVLSELSPLNLIHGWWNINMRLNQIILSLHHNINLNSSNIGADELQAILLMRKQVISLTITKKWCGFLNQFVNLRVLRIMGWTYPFSTTQIKAKSLPHLTHLEFEMGEFDWDDFMSADNHHYARQIVRCHLYKLLKTPTVFCPMLRSVKFRCCSSEALASILCLGPNLIFIDIGLHTPDTFTGIGLQFAGVSIATKQNEYRPFNPTPTHHFNGMSHSNLHHVKVFFEAETTLKWLDLFLNCTPNVTHFSLKIARSYEVFSFVELHRIVSEHLPNLLQRNFRLDYCCLPKKFNLEKHRSIGPLYKTMIAHEAISGPMRLLSISVNVPKKFIRTNND